MLSTCPDFFSWGHYCIYVINNRLVIISAQGQSTKTGNDWFAQINQAYVPYREVRFTYIVDDTIKVSKIAQEADGQWRIRFNDLNKTSYMYILVVYNIA